MSEITLDNFVEAFSNNAGSSYATCNCGKSFVQYGFDYTEMDVTKEKFASYKKQGLIILNDYGGWYLEFEGKEYVVDCDCWKERAELVINFINGHEAKIINFLNLERARKYAELDRLPKILADNQGEGGEND